MGKIYSPIKDKLITIKGSSGRAEKSEDADEGCQTGVGRSRVGAGQEQARSNAKARQEQGRSRAGAELNRVD